MQHPDSLLETANADSQVLRLTKEMMFLLFTYHQVSPWYLNFLTCLDSSTGASDLSFGGFRPQLLITNPGSPVQELGRSGCHYHLSFRLQSIQRLENARYSRWRKHNAAIYHQFDVSTGRALWIITSPLENVPDPSDNGAQQGMKDKNYVWDSIRECINQGAGRHVVSEEPHERFAASLSVLGTIAEWSVGDYGFNIHELEKSIKHVVCSGFQDTEERG